ncbi:hypothetical protein A2875_04390 [Candidatus Gottesmanbacteria bacterium RIFCSPHIGHO2_01_FULL_46_14]|uniref:TrpR like protein, YerC/YecD n=3 Tax=Candidatus Gottesmaniibacteriota TaxID=1752720 RepID=A0A1F5ZJF6_9BACT|nr:MAG: TrpR like protein, YerC/YecD [Candidatus Gottesmanbacteria bacterium GW2011_GWA1_47_8]OGG12483.1 MAG: hypothetical protein A2875_04390 [Candidatus Gottesmanbacteria bacterium RIFCSPHIGHO2_01_FULL_46_14]OGG29655.1 MAG: hypothetical protein A2971_01285 [Candidatus Gottesmanbacteria bacterium RIFCSPLOWO2_01_FULL_46_21]
MTQVSRVSLPKHLEAQMHAAIRKAFADLKTEDEVAAFLDDILTPTEKVMLGKRLAIAILLDKGYDQRTICTIMKTSLATVNQVSYWFKNKGTGYRIVVEKLKKQKEWEEIKLGLEEFLKDFFTVHGQLKQLRDKIPKEVYPRENLF